MSYFLRPFAPALLALPLLLTACALPQVLKVAEAGRQVTTRPMPITAVGDAAPFDGVARVPARHLRKGVAYELLLRYRYEHGLREDTLGRITFTSGNYVYDENNKALLVATQKFSLPNTPNRSPGELLARPQVR